MSSFVTAKLTALGMVCIVSTPVIACDDFTASSVVVKEEVNSAVCKEIAGTIDGISEQFSSLFKQREAAKKGDDDYWEQWAFSTENNPIVSGRLEKNVVGVGLWLPEEFEETENEMPYDEWLKSHGLQVSFAIGDKGKEPRVRFDYRWHEAHSGDLLFQLEVPF